MTKQQKKLVQDVVDLARDRVFLCQLLRELAKDHAKSAFKKEVLERCTNNNLVHQAMGLIISSVYAWWTPSTIAEVAAAAFEDANCHETASYIRDTWLSKKHTPDNDIKSGKVKKCKSPKKLLSYLKRKKKIMYLHILEQDDSGFWKSKESIFFNAVEDFRRGMKRAHAFFTLSGKKTKVALFEEKKLNDPFNIERPLLIQMNFDSMNHE